MFVISDKLDKDDKMCPTYETLPEEKSDTLPKETNATSEPIMETDYKRSLEWECGCDSLVKSILVCVLCFLALWAGTHYLFATRNKPGQQGALLAITPGEQTHAFALTTINESQSIVAAISQENNLIANRNKQSALDYLNGIQEALRKRVEFSVKKISSLILDRVQDIENELAVFERSVSTLVDGIVDVTKHSIADIKSDVNRVLTPNDTSKLSFAIRRVEDEISQLMNNFDQMYSYQGGHVNDILYQKAQNITDRIRMILAADRKLFRNVAWQHAAFCYNISRQNCDISSNLEKVLEAMNKLHSAIDTLNVISSAFVNDPLIEEDKYTLSVALNETEEVFHSMMNSDSNFLGTTLKELAYQKHMEMREFVYKSYESVITSAMPAIERVTRDFKVVKDSHWQQIMKVVNPELIELGKLIQTKASSLITIDQAAKNSILKDSEFRPSFLLMTEKFKNVSSTVNSALQTKQSNMNEGFSLSLIATMDEQLPLIATWSLKNYLPSDICPMSVEFQTYLKSTMTQYLSQSTNLQVVPAILDQAFELDADFEYSENASDADSDEENVANENDKQSTVPINMVNDEAGMTDIGGFIGSIMEMINTVLGSAGLQLDGPVEVFIDEDGKKK